MWKTTILKIPITGTYEQLVSIVTQTGLILNKIEKHEASLNEDVRTVRATDAADIVVRAVKSAKIVNAMYTAGKEAAAYIAQH